MWAHAINCTCRAIDDVCRDYRRLRRDLTVFSVDHERTLAGHEGLGTFNFLVLFIVKIRGICSFLLVRTWQRLFSIRILSWPRTTRPDRNVTGKSFRAKWICSSFYFFFCFNAQGGNVRRMASLTGQSTPFPRIGEESVCPLETV